MQLAKTNGVAVVKDAGVHSLNDIRCQPRSHSANAPPFDVEVGIVNVDVIHRGSFVSANVELRGGVISTPKFGVKDLFSIRL